MPCYKLCHIHVLWFRVSSATVWTQSFSLRSGNLRFYCAAQVQYMNPVRCCHVCVFQLPHQRNQATYYNCWVSVNASLKRLFYISLTSPRHLCNITGYYSIKFSLSWRDGMTSATWHIVRYTSSVALEMVKKVSRFTISVKTELSHRVLDGLQGQTCHVEVG